MVGILHPCSLVDIVWRKRADTWVCPYGDTFIMFVFFAFLKIEKGEQIVIALPL